ncbi:MAG TPA: HEAT repeat domain-containing protein [bacterium]|nr:HEAT repeat domain-containing protein [bacterium]
MPPIKRKKDIYRVGAGRGDIKQKLAELVTAADPEPEITALLGLPRRPVIKALLAELMAGDEKVKGRLVAAVGRVAAAMADENLDAARDLMRRQIWNLNEDSGGCPLGTPEAMAEIMANHDVMAREFAHVLVSFITPGGLHLNNERLMRGAVWGIGRLAQKHPGLVADAAPLLARMMDGPDHELRDLAATALERLGREAR